MANLEHSETARKKAKDFLENETQFHLGFLPTEQSNPKTCGMDEVFGSDIIAGIGMLQSVDRDIVPMAREIFSSNIFQDIVAVMTKAIEQGNKIVFSGCGATGRLSIMLESCWKKFWNERDDTGRRSRQVRSIMTGGDYALVKSVEFFEDFVEFGRQQVREACMRKGDVLVAITEGGETSTVLGTVEQALADECQVYLMFNNPAEVLAANIYRSKKAIEDPRVKVLDISCGPMALAGSTRMQATTSELLIAGVALEQACSNICGESPDNAEGEVAITIFEQILDVLESPESLEAMSKWISHEENIYRNNGLVTYYADGLMLDIFTDTTERSPTFTIPPFVRYDDHDAPQPWAFVKNPVCDTPIAWQRVFNRPANCLEWKTDLYLKMGTPPELAANPPKIDEDELYKFKIGREDAACRQNSPNSAILIVTAEELKSSELVNAFIDISVGYENSMKIAIGFSEYCDIVFPVGIAGTKLGIWERLVFKLILNTVSTSTMVRLGRVRSNWMSCVQLSNKKLIDRSIRLISELAGLSYSQACLELFAAQEAACSRDDKMPLVEFALKNLKAMNQ